MKGYINKFNEARGEIASSFIGLPHAHQSLINSLLTRANPTTGVVENVTYGDLANILTVEAAPGRKDSGTPQKQTIRSYLRTIESQCGADFKMISDGQTLKIQFPTLPAIYASHFDYKELYTDQNTVSYTATTLINIDENAIHHREVNRKEYTEPYTDEYTPESVGGIFTPAYACAKIKPNFKTQKQTNTRCDSFSQLKQPICRDFRPTQETIDLALSKGFVKVTSDIEIKRFVMYNLASGTLWADYNPVFLTWLERDHNPDSEEPTVTPSQRNLRKNSHEQRSINNVCGSKPTVADSIKRNQQIIDEHNQRQANHIIECEYFESVAISGGAV